MKNLLFAASILLLAPFIASAQSQEKAPSIALPRKQNNATPALDGFAGIGSKLQLQTRWVQIDSAILPTALPAWQKLGVVTSSHVATPDELIALEILRATGTASVTEQKINAINNQIATLSFSPFTIIKLKQEILPEPGPIDDMIVPRSDSVFSAPPYIPNLAKPESRLPEMAPMPGIGSKYDLPFTTPRPPSSAYVIPQISPETSSFMTYKFQLRPTLVGDEIALELNDFNSVNNIASKARVNAGETAVFSFPNILVAPGNRTVRRTFLLVTPSLPVPAPAKP